MDPSALLRPGLLAGRVVALGGGTACGPPLAALGATTVPLRAAPGEDATAGQARAVVAAHGGIDVLLQDLRPQFTAGARGDDPLRAALDGAWTTIRAVAGAAWIDVARDGRIALIAPPPGAPGPGDAPEPLAAAVRAAAENLARTLSIEWARHGIRTVALLPGAATGDERLAAVAAFLASPAGDYFSGCALALDELAVAPAPA